MKYPFPEWLDNTALTDFRSCQKKSEWATFRLLEPKPPSIHLHAGAAFARGLERARRGYFVEGLSPEDAVAEGLRALWLSFGNFETVEGEAKDWLGLSRALIHYFTRWPLDEDYIKPFFVGNNTTIEFSFAIPLGIKHPETGNPILYTGRADMFAQYQDSLWNEDDKTTKAIGPGWAYQWALRGQFIGYTFAGREYGHNIKGTIVRGVSIQKTMNRDAECIKPYDDFIINRWYKATIHTIEDMISVWRGGYFRHDFGHSCSAYGGCPFTRLCESPEPERWIQYYQSRVWDPLHKPDAS